MSQKQPNQVRIIAGEWRGRKIPIADVAGLRPTTDRVRETLFNWLMVDIAGARGLDLFAGSGALGLECLSRGAAFVQFVEENRLAATEIGKSLSTLMGKGGLERALLINKDALSVLKLPPQQPFELVFLDPPFSMPLIAPASVLLEQHGWLAAGCKIYVEQSSETPPAILPENWQLLRSATAGSNRCELYLRA